MPRDHRKLIAFALADELAVSVYRATSCFPVAERFGLQSQLRRAAVSAASNIVEGCAREGERELLRFLDISFGSCREVLYLVGLCERVGLLDPKIATALTAHGGRAAAAVARLRAALKRH